MLKNIKVGASVVLGRDIHQVAKDMIVESLESMDHHVLKNNAPEIKRLSNEDYLTLSDLIENYKLKLINTVKGLR